MSITACKKNEPTRERETPRKTLVAYFSATGVTEAAAKTLASVVGGDLYKIEPATEYTARDLDWRDSLSRSSVEMRDTASRPALKSLNGDIARYDTIYIGYPIWWYVAPRIINTFVEAHDLSGKTLIPFATSGSSGITESVQALRKSYPGLGWKDGAMLTRATSDDVRAWVCGK